MVVQPGKSFLLYLFIEDMTDIPQLGHKLIADLLTFLDSAHSGIGIADLGQWQQAIQFAVVEQRRLGTRNRGYALIVQEVADVR